MSDTAAEAEVEFETDAESLPGLAPTSHGDSLPEVSGASGDSFRRSLSSGNVDTQELLNIFWRSSSDWRVRAKVFGGLMFSAAGCHTLNFEDLNLNDSDNLPTAEEAEKLGMRPQALDPTFTARYSKFICQLFKMVPLDENGILFLRTIAKIVSSMMVNPWESVRKMGACTGLKLLTFCIKISSSADLESYAKKQFGTLKKNLENVIFKKAARDKFLSIRTLAVVEILVWAQHDPQLLLSRDVTLSLKIGLRDKKECAIYALTAIQVLFKEDLHDPRQITFFCEIHDVLVAHLGTDGAFAIKAMSILACAISEISLLREKLQKKTEADVIFFCVFNKYQAVAVDAAKYFFRLNNMEKDDPLTILKNLTIFNNEAGERKQHLSDSTDLLMDAFHPILKDLVTWEHWEERLSSCENEYTVLVAKMFLFFASKATTNYCPQGRVRCSDSPKKKDLLSATNDFTSFIAKTWKNIFSMEKIRLNQGAMSAFTRSVTFSNASLPSNVAFEIIKDLIKFVKESSSEDMLGSAWSAISHLYKMVPWDSASAMHLKSVFESIKNSVVEEFSDILPHSSLMMGNNSDETKTRLLFVIRFIEPYDNFISLWEKCAETLELECANTKLDVSKVGKILQVLHRILIRQFQTVTAFPETSCSSDSIVDPPPNDSELSVSSDLINQLLSRGQFLQKHSLNFVQNNEPLKMLSFDILVDMVMMFGKHMAGHPTCMMLSDTLDPEVEPQLLKEACDATRRTNCKVTAGSCCHVLELICQLFSEGIFDITKIHPLLSLSGVNEDHDVMIISAVKAYADRYPAKFLLVAAAIASGLYGVVAEVFHFAEETDDIDHVWRTAADKMKEKFEYWQLMLDFQAILNVQKISQSFQMLVMRIAEGTNCAYLLSATSELCAQSATVDQTDAESATGDSEAAVGDTEAAAGDSEVAVESDFSLAFAERSMIPHSTPHPSAVLAEMSDEPSED